MRKSGVSRRQVRSELRWAVGLSTVGGRAARAGHAIVVVYRGLREVLQMIWRCCRGSEVVVVVSCVDVVKVCAEKQHYLREAANVMRHQARLGGLDVSEP